MTLSHHVPLGSSGLGQFLRLSLLLMPLLFWKTSRVFRSMSVYWDLSGVFPMTEVTGFGGSPER